MIPAVLFLLSSILLQIPQTVTAKDYDLDFTKYCRLYKDLLTFRFEKSFEYRPLVREVWLLFDKLTKQGFSRPQAKSRCKDASMYFKTECLFLKREHFVQSNDYGAFFYRGRAQAARKLYFDIWILHPALRDCQRITGYRPAPSQAKKSIVQAMNRGVKVYEIANVFIHPNHRTAALIHEIDELCGREDSDATFCTDLVEIVRLAEAYYIGRVDKPQGFKRKAYRLHYAMLQQNNPGLYSSIISSEESKALIKQNMEQMFAFINNGQVAKLREMAKALPQKAATFRCDHLVLLPKSMKKICMFWKASSQIRSYLQSLEPLKNGMVKKMLNTRIDYPTFLRQTEMNEILSSVKNQNTALMELSKWVTNEAKKDLKKRFTGLKTYFQKVSSFNRDKAHADMGFIQGRLDDYKKDVTTLGGELANNLAKIIEKAFEALALEIAENTAQVTLAGAVLMNPLEKLFGGSSAGDFMDRAATLANTLTEIGKLGRASKTFNEIKSRLGSLTAKFNENDDFLDNVNALITTAGKEMTSSEFDKKHEKFLKGYKDYDPKIKRPELEALTSSYGNLVDACCDVVMDLETSAAAPVKAFFKSSGICPETKEIAQKLFVTLAEIYDFQFDLIEAMASYMRALTTHQAADDIDADYDELANINTGNVIEELKSLTLFAFMSFKVNIWGISEAYCDVLTYKEGGNPPRVCSKSGPKDIARLVSYVSPICRNTEAYRDVPITSDSDQAFMNLTDLYAGNSVYFQIPSSQWLVDNRWISAKDKNSIIVTKKFEVFLPEESTFPRLVSVNSEAIGDNKLSTSSKVSHVIIPRKQFIFQYNEGAGSEQGCRQTSQVLNNPYGASLSKLCRLNVDENNCQELLQKTPLFPSVYSRWKISVSGYESIIPAKPANDNFSVKVGVKLCILQSSAKDSDRNKKRKGSSQKMKDQERQSCPKPNYWSASESKCVPCPTGSEPKMDGYFCTKN